MNNSGHITIIGNPVAQNGRGAEAATRAYERLAALAGPSSVDLKLTEAVGHAAELVRQAAASGSQTIVAVGGDGVIHEMANALMTLDAADRPRLGVIPAGSGNDYAQTLGMSENIDTAVRQVFCAREVNADLGLVNGQYFTETLSFGLDAAIALGTVEARKKNGHKGTRLYLEVGLDQLMHHIDIYDCTIQVRKGCRVSYLDGKAVHGEALEDVELASQALLAAVQVGPTYGGGFHICPDAQIDDGLLDLCIAHPPLPVLKATKIFLKAKNGGHVGYPQVEFMRASSCTIRFGGAIPAQIDGERIEADEYDISIVPGALRVLTAR